MQSRTGWIQQIVLVLGLVSCMPNSNDSNVDSESSSGFIEEVNLLSTESNPLARYVEVALTTEGSVTLEFWHSNGPHFEKSFDAVDTDHFLPLIGLSADSTVHLVVHAKSGDQIESSDIFSFETVPLPFPSPEITILNPMEPDGVITVFAIASDDSPQINASYIGIDRTGEVVWIGRNGHTTENARFIEPYLNESMIDFAGKRSNNIINYSILDAASEVIFNIESSVTLHHDLGVLPNGNIVALAGQSQEVLLENGETKALRGDLVVELQLDGQIVWEWNSFDYLDPSTFQTPANDANDWTHGNNVQHLPATDEVLVGFRNLNLLLTIDRETGEITRRIGENGDYTLTSGQWFYGQHHSTLTENGSLTVFDNHFNTSEDLNSRVVQYQIDEAAKTIEEVWSIDLGHFYRSGGEASLLETGGILINAGGSSTRNSTPIQFIEIDENNTEIWKARLSRESIPLVYRSNRLVSGTRMAPEDETPSEN